MTTPDELNELRRAAEAARKSITSQLCTGRSATREDHRLIRVFNRKANPQAVLALLDDLAAARVLARDALGGPVSEFDLLLASERAAQSDKAKLETQLKAQVRSIDDLMTANADVGALNVEQGLKLAAQARVIEAAEEMRRKWHTHGECTPNVTPEGCDACAPIVAFDAALAAKPPAKGD